MAGGIALSVEPGKNYPGKMTFYVILACVFAATGGLIFGYDLGISGGVTSMNPFLEKFFPDVYKKQKSRVESSNQYCKFNNPMLTLFTSSLYLAALASCLVASHVTRKFGRRVVMTVGGAIFLFGALFNGFAQNLAMLIIGRVCLGFGVGLVNQSVPLYLSEMAPYKHRGSLNMMFQLAITIGILAANLVNYFTAQIKNGSGWRWSLGGAAIPGLIIFLGGLFLPDTPNSLLERNRPDKAKQQLQKIRGTLDVGEEFNDLVAASEASKKITDPWSRLFCDKKYRPQMVFAFAIPLFQQFTGINVVMFYAPELFKTLGFASDASLMSSLITGVVNVVATFVGISAVDKVGRRVLFLQGGAQMLLFQIAVGGLIWHKFGVSGVASLSSLYAGIVVLCICAYVAGFAWSWGPLGWLVPSEIFSLEVRSAAQSVNVAVNMIATFVIAQLFLGALCVFKFGLFFIFAFIVLCMSVFIYYLLPETKGVPIEEMMDKVWKQHSYWGRVMPDESSRVEVL